MNSTEKVLESLNIIDPNNIIEFFHSTRDNPNTKVYKCLTSGVIFLKDNPLPSNHYEETDSNEYLRYMGISSYEEVLKKTFIDDRRRVNSIMELILNKNWLDVGAGFGGAIKLGTQYANKVFAVEPQPAAFKLLKEKDVQVFSSTIDVPEEEDINVASLFHVLEHMFNPIEELKSIHGKLSKGGKIVVEVPHASDFLIKQLDSESFKKFTFWSEHLILHTRKSLEIFMKEAGFKNIMIKGVQRYNLANHLFWLKNRMPGGHQKWPFLNTEELEGAYESMLNAIDMTDTLFAIAEK